MALEREISPEELAAFQMEIGKIQREHINEGGAGDLGSVNVKDLNEIQYKIWENFKMMLRNIGEDLAENTAAMDAVIRKVEELSDDIRGNRSVGDSHFYSWLGEQLQVVRASVDVLKKGFDDGALQELHEAAKRYAAMPAQADMPVSVEERIHQSRLESTRLRLMTRKDVEPRTVTNDTGIGGTRDLNQLDANDLSNEELELFSRFYDLISRIYDAVRDNTDPSALFKSLHSFIADNVRDVETEEKYQRSVDVIRGQLQTLEYGLQTYMRYLKTDNIKKQGELKQKVMTIIEKWLS